MPNQRSLNRKISQELDKLQRQITAKLERYYKQNIRGSQLPVDFIRQNDKQIKGIIRDTIQSSWLFAHGIITDVTLDRVDLTTNDITGMESTTNDMENYFWQLSHTLLTRETAFKVENQELVELTPFDIHAAFVGIGAFIAYYGFNYAMSIKSTELGTFKLKYIVREDCVDTKICIPLNGRIFGPNDIPIIPPNDTHRHCHCKLIPVLI